MEALLDLREGLGTHLADKRERSKRKDRPICDEIRVPSEVLWQGNGGHSREMAAAASWHPRRRKRTAAIISTPQSRGLRPFEIARVLVRLDHVASLIVNVNHGIM